MIGASPFGFDNFSFRRLETDNSSLGAGKEGGEGNPISSYPLLIYEGSVDYWRTRETIHLSVFEHQKISTVAPFSESSICIEVVGYSPKLGIEAPHIYLNSEVLYGKFRRNEIADYRNKDKNNGQMVVKKNIVKCNNKFTIDAIRSYVLSRVGVLPSPSVSNLTDTTTTNTTTATTTATATATTIPIPTSASAPISPKSLIMSSMSLDSTRNIQRPEHSLQPTSTSSSALGLDSRRGSSSVFEIGFTPQLSDAADGDVILKQRPPNLGVLPVVNQLR